jgi:hypothetical protein
VSQKFNFFYRTDDSDTSDDEQDTPSFRSPSAYTSSEPANSDKIKPYRFWYSVEIRASPPPPEKVLDVCCAVLSAVGVEITVCNPSDEEVVMNVILEGQGVYGDPTVYLGPRQQTLYQARFTPTVIGMQQGRYVACVWILHNFSVVKYLKIRSCLVSYSNTRSLVSFGTN